MCTRVGHVVGRFAGANPAVKIMTKKGPDGAQKMKLTSVDSFFKLFQPIRPPEDGKLGINEYEEMKEVCCPRPFWHAIHAHSPSARTPSTCLTSATHMNSLIAQIPSLGLYGRLYVCYYFIQVVGTAPCACRTQSLRYSVQCSLNDSSLTQPTVVGCRRS